MVIRKATSEDFEQLVYIDANSGHPIYEKNPENKKGIKNWLKPITENPLNEFYIFEKEDQKINKTKIIGTVALKKDFPVHNSCELKYIAVLKKEHGTEVSDKLLNFAEKRATELNFERIFLYTGLDNVVAQSFYKRNNYQKINEFPGYYSWGDTAILYGKKLK